MPLDYWVDSANGILVTRVMGTMTDDAILGYMERLIGDASWPDGMDGFVDSRGLEGFEVTAKGIERARVIGMQGEQRFAGSRWAIVADQDAVFGMSRMYELQADSLPFTMQVFRDPALAAKWLGLEKPIGGP